MKPTTEPVISKAEQGRRAETRAIQLLARFGALTRRQIGRICYPGKASMDDLGHSLCTRMLEKELVIRRKTEDGTMLYALSARGAARHLTELGEGAQWGTRLLHFDSKHRRAADDKAIELMEAWGEEAVFTEKEIQGGRAPVKKVDGKIPDGLAITPEGGVHWVEIEACRRGGRDLANLTEWIAYKAFGAAGSVELPEGLFIERVVIVAADHTARTISGRVERALTRLKGEGWTDNRVDYE